MSRQEASKSMSLFLTLSDLFLSIFTLFDALLIKECDTSKICSFIAVGTQFFTFSSFFWTAAISNFSVVSVVNLFETEASTLGQERRGPMSLKTRRQRSSGIPIYAYHIICWGASMISVLLMLASASVGYISSTHSCWITTESNLPFWASILLFIVPLLFVEIYNISVFRFLAKTLRSMPFSESLMNRFTRYLYIVIGTKTFLIVFRCIQMFNPYNISFSTAVFCNLACPLQGIGDYLIIRDSDRNFSDEQFPSSHHSSISTNRGVNDRNITTSVESRSRVSTHSIDPLIYHDDDTLEIEDEETIRNPVLVSSKTTTTSENYKTAYEIVTLGEIEGDDSLHGLQMGNLPGDEEESA